jgi:hypothetical protein
MCVRMRISNVCFYCSTFTPVLDAFENLQKLSVFVVAVRPSAWNSSAPNLWIFVKFYKYSGLLSASAGKDQALFNSDKLSGTLPEYLCTFTIIPCRILPEKEKSSDKSCRENQNTHFMSNTCHPKFCILRGNYEKRAQTDRPQM